MINLHLVVVHITRVLRVVEEVDTAQWPIERQHHPFLQSRRTGKPTEGQYKRILEKEKSRMGDRNSIAKVGYPQKELRAANLHVEEITRRRCYRALY